jgi:hypothetical protein
VQGRQRRRLLGLRLAGGALAIAAAAMALPAPGQAASVQNIHPPSGAALIEGPVTLRWDLDVSDCDPGKTAVTQVQVEVDGQPGPAYLPEPAGSGLNAGLFAAAAGDGFRFTLNAVNVRTDGAPSVYRWRAFVDCTGPGIPPDPTAVPIQAVGPWSEFRVTRLHSAPGATQPPASGGGPGAATAPKPKTTREPKRRTPAKDVCYAKNLYGQDYKGRLFWRSIANAAAQQAQESAEAAELFDIANLIGRVLASQAAEDSADISLETIDQLGSLRDSERRLAAEEARAAATLATASAEHDAQAEHVAGRERAVEQAKKDVEKAKGKRGRTLRRAEAVLERRTESLVKSQIKLEDATRTLERATNVFGAAQTKLAELRAAIGPRLQALLRNPAVGGALKLLGIVNMAQGLAAGHMATYAALAGIAEGMSRPRPGCKNDPLDKIMPVSRAAASRTRVRTATAIAPTGAATAPVVPGIVFDAEEAPAVNALMASLTRQARAARLADGVVRRIGRGAPTTSQRKQLRSAAGALASALRPGQPLRERLAASLADVPVAAVDGGSAAAASAAGPSPALADAVASFGATGPTRRLVLTAFRSPVAVGTTLNVQALIGGLGDGSLDRRASRGLRRIG